jgi:hypothetical protein
MSHTEYLNARNCIVVYRSGTHIGVVQPAILDLRTDKHNFSRLDYVPRHFERRQDFDLGMDMCKMPYYERNPGTTVTKEHRVFRERFNARPDRYIVRLIHLFVLTDRREKCGPSRDLCVTYPHVGGYEVLGGSECCNGFDLVGQENQT